jgi:hypothetical protein
MQRRILSLLVGIALISTLAATGAWAQSAHFIGSQTSARIDGTTCELVVDFKASGFGSGTTVIVSLDAETPGVTLGCLNKGGNEPSGLETGSGAVTAEVAVPSNRTGTVSGSIRALPQSLESFSCPSANMRVVCVEATYCDIVIVGTDGALTTEEFAVTRGTTDGCVVFP